MPTQREDDKVTLIAVGDVMPDRDEPETIFELSSQSLQKYDIRFGQLEIVLSERGSPCSASRVPRRTHPRNVRALKAANFDVLSFAGNHTLDWGPEAMFDTIDICNREGIKVVGAGADINEARKPVILERKGTRVAFLGYNSILPAGFWADIGKPGCAPLRVRTLYEMIEPDQPGCPPRILTYPHKGDMDAMLEDIGKAKSEADVVVLSLHWGLHFTQAKLATYQQEVAYAAIDRGADIIIGTHAHILKGFEVYKGKVIFYSLGNFALDSGLRNYPNFTPGQREMFELFNWVIEPEWAKTYPHPPDSRKTIAVKCVISDKRIERVSFLPAMINIKAQPRLLSRKDEGFTDVVEYMDMITREAGLHGPYKIEDNEVVILV